MAKQVFINCPYDEDYKELFFALIYLCEYHGVDPIFAACDESSSDRMTTIVKCIKQSTYAIHDISKINEDEPRFNMPFELGMYYMHIHEDQRKRKKMLILEGERFKSDVTLSDLSGSEIKCHNNNIEGIFKATNPFLNQIGEEKQASAAKLCREYKLNCFHDINKEARKNGYNDCLELDFFEFKKYVKRYLKPKRLFLR